MEEKESLVLKSLFGLILFSLFLFAVIEAFVFCHSRCVGLHNVEIFLLPAEPGKTYEDAVKLLSKELSKFCKRENSFFKVDRLSYSFNGKFYKIECNGNVIEVNKDIVLVGTAQKKEER